MAHPSRQTFVSELLERLDRPAEVVWDEKSDRWDTGRRSLLAYDPAATHHLVVQDDAVVCEDLVAGIEQGLAWIPPLAPMVCYVGTSRPYGARVTRLVEQSREDRASWIVMDEVCWGVAIVVPTVTIEDQVAYCDTHGRDGQQYDWRMGRWFQHIGMEAYYPWPSLVDHRDSPSLVPGRSGNRHAHSFIGEGASALDQDWSGPRIRVARAEKPGERSRRLRQQMIEARRSSEK